jgi:hypothetical protein
LHSDLNSFRLILYMSLNEYVRYENQIIRSCPRKTTKEEWTERLEFVYNCSKDYMNLNKIVSDTHINYMLYKNKHLYTDDKETTTEIKSHLYKIYYDEYKKQSDLKLTILKCFTERFPTIKMPASQLEYYLYCCELYASHRLKGIEYNLPFPVETDVPTEEDFKLRVEATQHNSSQPEVSLDKFVEILRTKMPSMIGIKEKKKNVKKHTLSILLTQEKQKTKKLQEILAQASPL